MANMYNTSITIIKVITLQEPTPRTPRTKPIFFCSSKVPPVAPFFCFCQKKVHPTKKWGKFCPGPRAPRSELMWFVTIASLAPLRKHQQLPSECLGGNFLDDLLGINYINVSMNSHASYMEMGWNETCGALSVEAEYSIMTVYLYLHRYWCTICYYMPS